MLKFAFRNLLSRPMRSLLALLGLTVAIVGMVGLFSVAEGLDQQVNATFDRVPGLVAMQPGAPIPLFSRIPADWKSDIAAVKGVRTVNSEVWQRVNVIDGKMIISPPRFLFGTDIQSRRNLEHGVYRDDIVQGRFLEPADRGTFNTVVSKPIAEEFAVGLGDTLTVNGYDLTIVGIYHCGSLLLDVAIILDIGQVREMTRFDPASVSAFYIEQNGSVDDDTLAKNIQLALRDRNIEQWQPSSLGMGPGGSGNPLGDFARSAQSILDIITGNANSPGNNAPPAEAQNQPAENPPSATAANGNAPNVALNHNRHSENTNVPIEVRSAIDWAERFEDFSADLDILLTILTGIGVTIAVLSIVNTMLMSVTERIIEFGILKANGWTKLDVLKLITFESALLGVGGGVLGAALGWTGTQIANWYWETRIHLFASPGLLLFSVVFSTLLGIAGGLYPAYWATRMMPMEAIRRG